MFEGIEPAPPDAILGLNEAFRADPNPNKINLSVGVFQDATGNTPILECVKRAEAILVSHETTKAYIGISGSAEYGEAVQHLLFGEGHEILESARAKTAHTPGGTGALRVAADTLKNLFPNATLWLSEPTWPNHPAVFTAAGLTIKRYPYYDREKKTLDFEGMVNALSTVAPGDVVLLHGCCHNPSGKDPTHEEWQTLSDLLEKQKALPFLDFAYQGFGEGLDEDAEGLRLFCGPGRELLVASSFSKNFGLYRERVGALTVVASTEDNAAHLFSNVKSAIRSNYSNPPSHGAAIVSTVLGDKELRSQWVGEVKSMRDRINAMRRLFVHTMKAKGVTRDFSFLTDQRGMFSFSGLTKDQVATLREKHSIYIVGSGRINVAGITENNVDALCEAIAGVL